MELRLAYVLSFVALTTLVLLLAFRLGQRLLSPAHTLKSDVDGGNAAWAMLHVGQVLGIFVIATSVATTTLQDEGLGRDILWVAASGATSMILLGVTGHLGVRALLRAKLPQEIERGNVAAGIAAGSHFVATALIIARCVSATNPRELGIAVVFFVLAQITLHLFVILFRALTAYDDAEQILSENVAAALSYAGLTVAVGIITGHAVEGQFIGWQESLKAFGIAVVFNIGLYPVRQILVQSVLLGAPPTLYKGRIDEGVGHERNIGMGALEAISYIGAALAVTRLA